MLAGYFAQGITSLKSRCWPGNQFSSEARDPFPRSQIVGKVHCLAALLLRSCFLANCQPGVALSSWKLTSISCLNNLASIGSSQQGHLLSSSQQDCISLTS